MKFTSRSVNKSFIWDITDERNRGLIFGKKLKINTIGLKFSNQVTTKKKKKENEANEMCLCLCAWMVDRIYSKISTINGRFMCNIYFLLISKNNGTIKFYLWRQDKFYTLLSTRDLFWFARTPLGTNSFSSTYLLPEPCVRHNWSWTIGQLCPSGSWLRDGYTI